MGIGKAAAQASHAVVMAMASCQNMKDWTDSPHRTIIVLEARNEEHIRNVELYLLQRNIKTTKIIDEGVNETEPHVVTALSTGVLDKDDEYLQKTMSTFKLYRDVVKMQLEFER